MALITTRRFVFQAVHHLEQAFEGPHGHHFYVEVSFKSSDPHEVERTFMKSIYRPLHGGDLGSRLNCPTGESLVQWIHETLLRSEIGRDIVAVAVQETSKNRFISSMSEARYV